jgi:hypothetical protein
MCRVKKLFLAGTLTGALVCVCVTTGGAVAESSEGGAPGDSGQTYEYIETYVPLYQNGALSASPPPQARGLRALRSGVEQARAAVLEGLENLSGSIDLEDYGLTIDDLRYVFSDVVNSNPQLFYVSGNFRYSSYPDTGIVVTFTPVYIGTASEIAAQQLEYEHDVSRALAAVPPGCTDVEKVLAINDYIVTNCEYDHAAAEAPGDFSYAYSSYGALVNKTAVCQGYALAFLGLMTRLDVETLFVPSEQMNHAWNLVKLGGNWYHVDTTWNDPPPDMLGCVSHEYLLLSDSAVAAAGAGQHYGWDVSAIPSANDAAYDSFFWREVETQIIPRSDLWYYIEHVGAYQNQSAFYEMYKLLAYSFSSGVQAEIYAINTENINDPRFGVSVLAYYGEHLYYTTYYAIYRIKFDGTEKDIFHDAGQGASFDPDEKIYDMVIRGGNLLYRTRTSRDGAIVKSVSVPLNGLLLGDVNGDGAVTAADRMYLTRYLAHWPGYDLPNEAAADVNRDGSVTAADRMYLTRYLAHWPGYDLEQ